MYKSALDVTVKHTADKAPEQEHPTRPGAPGPAREQPEPAGHTRTKNRTPGNETRGETQRPKERVSAFSVSDVSWRRSPPSVAFVSSRWPSTRLPAVSRTKISKVPRSPPLVSIDVRQGHDQVRNDTCCNHLLNRWTERQLQEKLRLERLTTGSRRYVQDTRKCMMTKTQVICNGVPQAKIPHRTPFLILTTRLLTQG